MEIRKAAEAAAVAVACLALLGGGAGERRIGAGYLDPVGGIRAQDEAVYSHAALRMAERGKWLTPVFLGRYFLYKPPLIYWLSSVSVRLIGPSALALRLPSILAGAAVCVFVFLLVRRKAGLWHALFAVALAATNPLLHGLSRRNLTDALLCAALTAAAFFFMRDPGLLRRSTMAGLAAALAAGVLAKSVAGLLGYAVAGLCPERRRMAACFVVSLGLALPWFLYQYQVHPRWFRAEFVDVELLAWGGSAPPQTSRETQAGFYARRLWMMDPAVAVAAVAAVGVLLGKMRQRKAEDLILIAWVVVMGLAPLLFRYRNVTYMLPMIPALAVLAGLYVPWPKQRLVWLPGVAAAGLIALKLAFPAAVWGLDYRTPEPAPLIRLAESYCQIGRSNELIVVSSEEEFYATVLPLAKVRYALEGTGQPPAGYVLDFRRMGIVLGVDEYWDWERTRKRFAGELREWGLQDEEALGTVISLPAGEDLTRLVRGSPGVDFLVPARLRHLLKGSGHVVRSDGHGNALLLGESSEGGRIPGGPCRL